MKAANNTLDENIALFTAGQEIAKNASKVGNALRSISMRIRGRLHCLHIGKPVCFASNALMITI